MSGAGVVHARAIVDGSATAQPGWVVVDAGRVRARGSGPLPRVFDSLPARSVSVLSPGVVDAHVHGAVGADFGELGVDPSPAVAHHLAAGAAAVVASVATNDVDGLRKRLEELRDVVRRGELAGIHLEGPWLSPSHRGAHRRALLHPPTLSEASALLDAAGGTLRMVTLAPELPNATAVTAHLVAAGVVVAIGHTAADTTAAHRAIGAGARVVTHLFNGMPALHHREPGLVGVALTDDRLALELIADGVHLHDTIVDLVAAVAPGRFLLVSDAMAATGLGPGRYSLAGSDVEVDAAGTARLADRSSLAGSTATLGSILTRQFSRGVPAEALLTAAAVTSRAALGLEPRRIEVGEPADLSWFDASGALVTKRSESWAASWS